MCILLIFQHQLAKVILADSENFRILVSGIAIDGTQGKLLDELLAQ
jgi:hypothetical protein